MKRVLLALLLIVAVGVGAGAYYVSRGNDEPRIVTVAVTKGTIQKTVAASGTLQAVTTVTVGTQVSGTVSWLGADFNSLVHRGQVIAKLDPSLLQAQVEQSRASMIRTQADVERSKVALADAQTKYTRAEQLATKQLLPQSDLDTAKAAVDSARAELQASQAQLVQAQAVLNQSQVNLEHTTITAPIDGTVIQRSVDVGQTVAASLSSPTIFIIAADLTKMQVSASVDEADIGQIQSGQPVTFTVDAYPGEPFTGVVSQVRLQATVVSNVTTYTTMIDVPNAAQKLKPGMTANVRIEIAQRSEALRVPNGALRFQPTADTFQALHQTAPASLSPKAERRAPGTAQLWTLVNGALTAVPVRTGISDGTNTELLADAGLEGTQVVTSVTTTSGSTAAKTTSGATNNPLLGTRQGPR